MRNVNWSDEKNSQLIAERGISFEEILYWVGNGGLLDVVRNESEKYTHQKMMIVKVNEYAYLVPFVESDEELFLKTIIPSRKATKKYLK